MGVAGYFYAHQEDDYSVLSTSLLGPLQDIAEDKKQSEVDLSVMDVTLTLKAEPKKFFNFYRYEADVLIKNVGGDLRGGVISLENGEKNLAMNELDLALGESYLFEDVELLLPGDWNKQSVQIAVKAENFEEKITENNVFEAEIYGLENKLEISKSALEKARLKKLEVWYSPNFEARKEIYHESVVNDLISSFGLIEISEEVLSSGDFRKVSGFKGDAGFYFLKKISEDGQKYQVSDILRLSEEKVLTRADFAELFVAEAELEAKTGEIEFFADVALDDEKAAAIYTMYGLGLLEDREGFFEPEKLLTRAEALKAVLDYFDVDFVLEGNANFSDLESDNPLWDYALTLFGNKNFVAAGEEFHPDAPATDVFVKFLIDEYL